MSIIKQVHSKGGANIDKHEPRSRRRGALIKDRVNQSGDPQEISD